LSVTSKLLFIACVGEAFTFVVLGDIRSWELADDSTRHANGNAPYLFQRCGLELPGRKSENPRSPEDISGVLRCSPC
jgi:hypothetical protein